MPESCKTQYLMVMLAILGSLWNDNLNNKKSHPERWLLI